MPTDKLLEPMSRMVDLVTPDLADLSTHHVAVETGNGKGRRATLSQLAALLATSLGWDPFGRTAKTGGVLAIPITHGTVELVTGDAEALTLADGVEGQTLNIVMFSDGGAGTLAATNIANLSTSIVFDDIGDSASLFYSGFLTQWVYIGGTATAS